ncbi:hypothetical protein RHS01_05080 [Rhizoctonia solani]|uniref:EF-hand domain-containing protein n=1 Tax=Rhizoctonia solani TaxID=456999 RepID=A0A8H7IE77_9AGAM|nr:hypothetical protein RHS01_05080 [Rhizoctonia solani]
MSDSGEDEFNTLKPSLRRIIDTAFLKLSKQARSKATRPPQKKLRLEEPESDGEGGGFVKDDQGEREASEEEDHDSIPLSMIPTGLQMLDLPPDDEEAVTILPSVLSVFRNAATGWETRPGIRRRRSDSDDEGAVDKDVGLSVSWPDWREVCAVLLNRKEDSKVEEETATRSSGDQRTGSAAEKRRREEESDEEGGFIIEDENKGGRFVPGSDDESGGSLYGSNEGAGYAHSGSDSDRYSDNDDDSSASEFRVSVAQAKSTRSKTKNDADSDVDIDIDGNWDEDMPRSLTVRQLREAKLAFALFFPGTDVADSRLNTKRLGVKEVREAAKTLKENLSSNDIIEMLGMFSSAPDGSIGLEEFGRMAVMARLI